MKDLLFCVHVVVKTLNLEISRMTMALTFDRLRQRIRELKQPRWQRKTSIENKDLANDDYFVIIASSSHPLLLTNYAKNGLAGAPYN